MIKTNNNFGLTDEQFGRFKNLQDKHYHAWTSKNRQNQHSMNNIEKVTYDPVDDLFCAYYKQTKHFNEEWYHYDTNKGVWW